jgi:beta-glucosidase-like glycosyl hydrolase
LSDNSRLAAAAADPQYAYDQARLDAGRLLASGINTDFAPLADVYQGGAVDQSRMFGTIPNQVITYAGAFLDGLQQDGVEGTLKQTNDTNLSTMVKANYNILPVGVDVVVHFM